MLALYNLVSPACFHVDQVRKLITKLRAIDSSTLIMFDEEDMSESQEVMFVGRYKADWDAPISDANSTMMKVLKEIQGHIATDYILLDASMYTGDLESIDAFFGREGGASSVSFSNSATSFVMIHKTLGIHFFNMVAFSKLLQSTGVDIDLELSREALVNFATSDRKGEHRLMTYREDGGPTWSSGSSTSLTFADLVPGFEIKPRPVLH